MFAFLKRARIKTFPIIVAEDDKESMNMIQITKAILARMRTALA
jgi:hypothetical protein